MFNLMNRYWAAPMGGGVGLICVKMNGLSYRNIECSSDRLCGVQVSINGVSVMSVFGVYLPYNKNTLSQSEEYLETLDELQGLINNCDKNVPIIIMGDMNTSLPQNITLQKNWYRQHPYNNRSVILYDFILDNNLCVGNFMFQQNVNTHIEKMELCHT